MSKLDELIAKLCPDGVESISMGSLMTRVNERGKDAPDIKQVYAVSNTLGMVRAEEYHENTIHSEDTSNYTVVREGMVAYNPSRLNIGSIAMLKSSIPGLVSPMYIVFSIDEEKVTRKYFEYIMHSSYVANKIDSFKEEGARFRFDFSRWNWIWIQVPPKQVQDEIVRILDNFTELTAELTAELAARKKQYEYFREFLLMKQQDTVKFEKLGLSCKMKSGKAIPATEISNDCTQKEKYICYGANGVRGYVKMKSHSGNYPIIGRQGALCGNVCFASGDFYATEHAVVVTPGNEYDARYLYHLLVAANLNQYKTAGAQPGLSVARLEQVELPIPPLEEQHRIGFILDRFDTLCSDISNGLPAEIAARQKQYEYYRDKLLTFKQKGEVSA